MKLKTLKPRLSTLVTQRIPTAEHAAGERPAGRNWQKTRERIQVRDLSLCAKCGELWVSSRDMVDHVIPRWAGGSDDDSNLWLLHTEPCHKDKSAEEDRMRAAGGYVMPEWVAALRARKPKAGT